MNAELNKSNKLKILLVDNYDSFTFNLKHLILTTASVDLTVKRNDQIDLKELENNLYDAVIIGPGPGSPEDTEYFALNRNIVLDFATQGLPTLGVCLGFQGIYHLFGGKLKLASSPVHGKISKLKILEPGLILNQVPHLSPVMRYHSIMADCKFSTTGKLVNLPDCLKATAIVSDTEREFGAGNFNQEFIAPTHENADTDDTQVPDSINSNSDLNNASPYKESPAESLISGSSELELMSLEHREHPIYGVQFHPESFATQHGALMLKNFFNSLRKSSLV
jgi:anthranilate synthase component 2